MPCLVCARAHLQAAFPWAIYSYVLNYTWWLRVLAIQHVDLNPDTSIHVTSCAQSCTYPRTMGHGNRMVPEACKEWQRGPDDLLCASQVHTKACTPPTQTPHSHTFKIKQNTWLVWVPPPPRRQKPTRKQPELHLQWHYNNQIWLQANASKS